MTVNVVLMDMEYGVHEQLTQNHDGSYTMFLNARDSHETRKESYVHAMGHIMRGDFEKRDVQEIESAAHKKRQKK